MRAYDQPVQRHHLGDTRRRVQLSFVAIGAAIALLSLIGSADEGFPARAPSVTPVVARLTDIPSHNGGYRASLITPSDTIELDRPQTLTVQIRTATGAPVEGALLALESWMPNDESVRVARPRAIAELGGGVYRAEGLPFGARGWWNLRLQIASAGVTDSLAFNLVLR